LGWFIALVLLTEINDISQAFWGRIAGRNQLAPELSPGKTWEGAVGGILSTSVLAVFVLPFLTAIGRTHPFGLVLPIPHWIWPLTLGIVLAVAGIGGDLIGSSLKRKRGVKDAGDLLPAQGGILDRFDSLAMTAPVFFLLSYLMWIRSW
jgi:phosphatidate cytidylyltransferase